MEAQKKRWLKRGRYNFTDCAETVDPNDKRKHVLLQDATIESFNSFFRNNES